MARLIVPVVVIGLGVLVKPVPAVILVTVPEVGIVQVGAPPPLDVSTWPFVPAVAVIAEVLAAVW